MFIGKPLLSVQRLSRCQLQVTLVAVSVCLILMPILANAAEGDFGPGFTGLMKGVSRKNILENAYNRPSGSLYRTRRANPDTLRILALRVEFNNGEKDALESTTGTGLFGRFDDELEWYRDDTTYRYDKLPHNKRYFEDQFAFLRHYFHRVSGERLDIQATVYPREADGAYTVPEPMISYSPAGKKDEESYDEYGYRKTVGLMRFVKDAVAAVAASPESPFSQLRLAENGAHFVDSNGVKTAVMILHAGSSFLTNDGFFGKDTQADIIDAFISQDYFRYLSDTLAFDSLDNDDRRGVLVDGYNGTPLLIDEVMLASETSNQDRLNWGIHGILVNQVARQIGIPDLFSTFSGISAIGAFCIMDFAGYSAGKGFIPPYPSAWVRAFMGWDRPLVVEPGRAGAHRVRAVGAAPDLYNDTTMLLIPINDHEYFLIENRQRALPGDTGIFDYDTTGDNKGKNIILPFPFNVNLENNIDSVAGEYNAIMRVKNYDVSLPASGLVVWHIDEQVIRDRLEHNAINADSTFRGVKLVEADGINDLGITFQDAFYQAAFDYGGAEDIFPHTTIRDGKKTIVDEIGPFSRPSTRANDGGNTYLTMRFSGYKNKPVEKMIAVGNTIENYASEYLTVSVSWDNLVAGWPRRTLPDSRGFFEPVMCDLFSDGENHKELVLVSKSGRIAVWTIDSALTDTSRKRTLPLMNQTAPLSGDSATTRAADSLSVGFLDSVPGIVDFPTVVGNSLCLVTPDSLLFLDSITAAGEPVWSRVALPCEASTYGTVLEDGRLIVGGEGGCVAIIAQDRTPSTMQLAADSAVSAVAALDGDPGLFVCIQNHGVLSILDADNARVLDSTTLPGESYPPYSVVTGDLDGNDSNDIVVADSRQGLWAFTRSLQAASGWQNAPVDWASVYTFSEDSKATDRKKLPVNLSPPALADINSDGRLDIIVGGTNGIYAFNDQGVLLYDWPSYLDRRYWYQRGIVTTAPVVAQSSNTGEPLVVFSSPTGERPTFEVVKVSTIDTKAGKVTFRYDNGKLDSITDLTRGFLDSLSVLGDSLLLPYIMPGGLVDALGPEGKRPETIVTGPFFGGEIQSPWPLTVGTSPATAPLLCDMDGDNTTDLISVSGTGWVYRWELENVAVFDTLVWPQVGSSNRRSFAFSGARRPAGIQTAAPIDFFSYPNPTNGADAVVFRFVFGNAPRNIRLDIFTYTGYHIYQWKDNGEYAQNWRVWQELPPVSLRNFGPGVYRCRMAATVNGKEESRFWKLAVVK